MPASPCTVLRRAIRRRRAESPTQAPAVERPPRKRALLVAVREEKKREYAPLEAAHDDVHKMRKLLIDVYHYAPEDIVVLADDGRHVMPTRKNILKAIDVLVTDVRSGDHVCFHYSGHSTQRPSRSNSEEDGLDEVMVACDSEEIVDNELYDRLVVPLPEGSFLVAVLDTCHSGSLLDLKHHRCNRVPITWTGVGPSKLDNDGPSPSPTPVRTVPRGNRRNAQPPTLEITTANLAVFLDDGDGMLFASPSPLPVWCTGWCRLQGAQDQLPELEQRGVRADIICLSACKDSQETWESEGHESMSSFLVALLREKQDYTIAQVVSAMSEAMYKMARQRQQRWDKFREDDRAFRTQVDASIAALQHPPLHQKRSETTPPVFPQERAFLQPKQKHKRQIAFSAVIKKLREPFPKHPPSHISKIRRRSVSSDNIAVDPSFRPRRSSTIMQAAKLAYFESMRRSFSKKQPEVRTFEPQNPELSSSKPVNMNRRWEL